MDARRRWGSSVRLPSYQELSKEQDKINNLPVDGAISSLVHPEPERR